MKRAVFAGLLGTAGCLFGYHPEPWQVEARHQFAEQRFGIFVHWGLYATYAQGEWYLEEGGLEEAEYARARHAFCPSKFDAREWVRIIKAAGARYLTITARHHDGFSLWPSKVDDGYNIANTPFKRDVIGELAAACRAAGIQLNLYYSLVDWHRADYPTGWEGRARRTLKIRQEDYSSYKRFMMRQIEELTGKYRPGCIWFDGEWDHDPDYCMAKGVPPPPLDWALDEIYDLIHANRVLVANNNHKPVKDREDISLFERDLPGENASGFSTGQSVTADRPLEQCDVIQENVWGYRIGERNFRTADEIVAMLVRAAAKGSNLLLNVGPRADGTFPARAVEVLMQVGKWLERNGESIYGTQAGPLSVGRNVVSTKRGKVVYVHFLDPTVSKAAFDLEGVCIASSVLDGCGSVSVERTEKGVTVLELARPSDVFCDLVVKLVCK